MPGPSLGTEWEILLSGQFDLCSVGRTPWGLRAEELRRAKAWLAFGLVVKLPGKYLCQYLS